jgi:hypothetical protein
LLLLAGCKLDLTGATCNTNENCPVRQYCAVPAGSRQGSCQTGERVNATLALSADPSILPAGGTTQAVATLTSEGGPPVPDGGLVTDLVSWSVDPSTADIISVGNSPGTRGLVQALRPGQGLLVGTTGFAGQQLRGTATIVVSNAALQRLVVVPDRVQYAAGTAGSTTATGFFSDGSHADLTSLVKWSSSAPSVMAVSTSSGSWGRLGAQSPGQSTIEAGYLELTGSTSVTVSDARLIGLSISPLLPHGVEGTDLGVEATGLFSDGSAQPMTRSVQWSVDDQSVGYFSSPGTVTLLSEGSTTVRAGAAGLQAQADLDVAPLSPAQLEISPALPDALQLGASSRLTAWLTHRDGTVVLDDPTWSSTSLTLSVSSAGEVTAGEAARRGHGDRLGGLARRAGVHRGDGRRNRGMARVASGAGRSHRRRRGAGLRAHPRGGHRPGPHPDGGLEAARGRRRHRRGHRRARRGPSAPACPAHGWESWPSSPAAPPGRGCGRPRARPRSRSSLRWPPCRWEAGRASPRWATGRTERWWI